MGNHQSSPPLPPPPFPPPSSPPWERRPWAPPATYSLLAVGLAFGVSHFCWVETRAGWAAFRGDRHVRAASFTSSPRVSESTLLLVRAAIFGWCFFILAQSAFHEGPGCLRFFTVWNFIVLTLFFGIGAGLSCNCCRHVARHGPITRDHRVWAGLHRLLFEIEMPMTMLVAVIVWFAIYPNAVSVAEQTGDYSGQLAVLSLTSITMHALNVIFSESSPFQHSSHPSAQGWLVPRSHRARTAPCQ